jgi:hypothetical protein
MASKPSIAGLDPLKELFETILVAVRRLQVVRSRVGVPMANRMQLPRAPSGFPSSTVSFQFYLRIDAACCLF